MEMILRMPFFIFNNANIQFDEKKLTWRFYTAAKALPTTKQIKPIDKKEFAKMAFDEEFGTFVIHVITLKVSPRLAKITMHPS